MIVQETIQMGSRELLKTYSDSGVMILQVETGEKYSEAVDIIPCPYTYEETDILIEETILENNISNI